MKSALILTLFSAALIGVRASATTLFNPQIDKASQDPKEFVTALNQQYLSLSQSLYNSLYDCYRGLVQQQKKQVADEIASQFSDWTTKTYTFDDGDEIQLIQLIKGRDLTEKLPSSVYAQLFKKLYSTNEKYGVICSSVRPITIGSVRFNQVHEQIKANLSSSWKRQSIKMALWTAKQTSTNLGATAQSFAQEFFPQEAILTQSWFPEFVEQLFADNEITSALSRVLGASGKDFEEIENKAFQILRPVQISYFGLTANNQVFPFVPWVANNHIGKMKSFSCLSSASASINKVQTTRSHEETFAVFNQALKESCPQISPTSHLSLQALEDRMNDWILPLASLLAEAAQTKELSANDTLKVRTDLTDQAEFERLKGMEQFSRQQRRFSLSTGYHHFAAPLYLKCEAQSSVSNPSLLKDFILLYGAAYQVLDAEAKLRLNLVRKEDIVKGAMEDLNVWKSALKFECIN